MDRSLFVFGNGLGMSLNSEYFSLSTGLKNVWNGSEHFRIEHKKLVVSAIPNLSFEDDFPEGEEQLDKLQVAIVASEFLRGFETAEVEWLNNKSREFPEAFRRFIHEVASYFHDSPNKLSDDFLNPLSQFIDETKSHVAVLNYDNLLYDGFVDKGLLRGYYGSLIDGFNKTGFSKKNLDRHNIHRHGWYLHLHGSPLFVGNRKLMRTERDFLIPDEQSHIVLTHVQHKPLVISSSKILLEYWSRFSTACKEVEKVILFGYSGLDTHLNKIIKSTCLDKKIIVIEWEGAGSFEERGKFWKKVFPGHNFSLFQIDNILNFVDWESI